MYTESEPLECRKLTVEWKKPLLVFLRALEVSDTEYFYPHPFTDDAIENIIRTARKDAYYVLAEGGEVLGYGMLRGWDEGYETPSLGIYVVDAHRGSGAAKALMDYLHHAAKLRGARCVRIRVHPDNARALRFYRKLGYRFLSELENDQLVGLCEAI